MSNNTSNNNNSTLSSPNVIISPSNSSTLRNNTTTAYSNIHSITGGMQRSGSNRSLVLRETSSSMKLTNSISSNRHRRHGQQTNSEEDTSRNLSIDYQEIQKRTLTKWVNAQLSIADDHIENMETDLRDGKRLLKLLSVVVNKEKQQDQKVEEGMIITPKPERGNMRIHQLSNVAQALSFLESQFLGEVPDIGNEPIVNGDLKKTLALIYFIMLKYHIHLILDDKSITSFIEHDNELLVSPSSSISKTAPSSPLPSLTASSTQPQQKSSLLSSAAQRALRNNNNNNHNNAMVGGEKASSSSATEAKLALLRWVRIQLHDYVMANIIPSIQDFSRSWRNGVAFCLLIHRHDPNMIPELFDTYLKTASEWNQQTWHRLLTTSFDIASEQMNIPRYLEPEDLTDVDYPHEPSVMMYVTEFYKVMSFTQKKQSQQNNDSARKQRAVCISDLLKFLGLYHQNDVGPLIEEQNEDEEQNTSKALETVGNMEVDEKHSKNDNDNNNNNNGEEQDKAEAKPASSDLPSDISNNSPIFDDLLSDSDALATFISSFSPAVEAMTKDEINSTEAITQRMLAFDAIREQADGQRILLDSINAKRQKLHSSELQQIENDDNTITSNNEQQRIQAEATSIYNDLEQQWADFMELMDSTADSLSTLHCDWKEGGDDAKRFQQRAASVEKEMTALKESLDSAYPTIIKKSSDGSDVAYPLQPLEEGSNESVDTYESSIAELVSSTDTFDENTWKSFEQLARDLCAPAMRIVSAQYTRLQKRHDNFIKSLSDSKNDCQQYKRGVSFADITRAINDELEIVRKTLNDSTKSVTEDAIKELENRVNVARSTVQAVREEYRDLLVTAEVDTDGQQQQQPSSPPLSLSSKVTTEEIDVNSNDKHDNRWYYVNHLQKIQGKYETVCNWVEQVRVWFIEAQRIRKWIAERIDIIEQRDGLMDDVDPLSIQLSLSDGKIKILYDEHQTLREEIEKFDADDMTRLRTHVKTLTGAEREKDLSPADTSTIEITLTTLNMLNRLMHLLGNRSILLDMLMLRIQWENLFADAVKWVASTDEEMNVFLHASARWSENTGDNEGDASSLPSTSIEEVIQTLVYLERKIADFDQEDYSHVLDAYQEMDELNHSSADDLPDYLEKRQEGFEKAFEDLMKRCAFCRKVVEQHLKVMEVVGQFRQIKDQGETLRQAMMETTTSGDNGDGTISRNHGGGGFMVNINEEEMFAEKVQVFKERSAYLITHFAAQVPYPDAPIMSTAIGTGDEQNNQVANESIKSTISAYGMSLALLADGLDQLLASRQYILSLHQRSKGAYDKMARLAAWMEERTRTLNKTKIDICDHANMSDMDEEEVTRMEKERDGIATRLAQIEQEDLATVLQEVRELEDDIDTSNAVSVDRHSLVSSIECLEGAHQQLQQILSQRAFHMDMVKRYICWQGSWTRSNHLILTAGRKIWDLCIKRARFDPSREDVDKPSYAHDNENAQAVQLLQDRVMEIGERHMSGLSDMHQTFVEKYTDMQVQMVRNYSNQSGISIRSNGSGNVPDVTTLQFLTDKQGEVEQKYKDLQHLLTYTTELMTQRSIITEFLLRVQDAQRDGEKIRDAITKMTRRIMEDQEAHLVVSRAQSFRQAIDAIWQECGQIMPYPAYNGSGLLRSLQPTETANYNAQIKAQIKALLDRKMDELQGLRESIDQLLEAYHRANHSKTLAGEYDNEASELKSWIDAQAAQLKQQHIDITADNATFVTTISDELMHDLENKHGVLVGTLKQFEMVRLKELHDKIANLMESTSKADIKSVDITVPVRRLGEVMSNLEQLKHSFADHRVTMEAASKRITWQKKLQAGRDQLEKMSEQLRAFNTNKNRWIAQDDFGHQHVEQLEAEWDDLIQQKDKFMMDTLPEIEQSYDTFVKYFAKLARPMATPDHIEAWMESLNRATNRFEENLSARSKELDLVRQRLSFDDRLQGSLTWLEKHQESVDRFIEDRARWTATSASSTTNATSIATDYNYSNDELRDAWMNLNEQYRQHCDKVIDQVLNDLNELREASSTASTNMLLVSDALNAKMQHLDKLQKRIPLDLAFAEGIVAQRCLMVEFLNHTAALEQSAEQIREEIAMLTRDKNNNNRNNDEETGVRTFNRIQELESNVQTIDRDISSKVPYPTRREVYSELSLDLTQQHVKDDVMNALVRDTIEIKSRRLAGLIEGMEKLLESKENISRRKMAIEAYCKELETCREWIDTRNGMLFKAREHAEPYCNIPGLRDGISLTDSIQSTCCFVNENAMTTLKTAFDKCATVCSEDEMPVDKQAAIEKAWDDLIDETARTKDILMAALVPAEIQERAQKLLLTFKKLEKTIEDADTLTITDEQISQWQKQVDELESRDYEQLQKDAMKLSNDSSTTTNIKERLDSVAESAVQVRRSITSLYDAVNTSRLQKTHGENANVVQARLEQVAALIQEAQGTHQHIDDAKGDMRQQYQQLVRVHKEVLRQQDDCKEAHNDLVSYYQFIQTQIDVDDVTKERQASIDAQWADLEAASNGLSQLVNDMAKWVDGHETLTELESNISKVKKDVDIFDTSNKTADVGVLDTASRQLQTIVHALDELAHGVTLAGGDNERKNHLLKRHAQVKKNARTVSKSIDIYRTEHLQQLAMDSIKKQAKDIESGCMEQLTKIQKCTITNIDDLNAVDNFVDVHGKILATARNKLNASQDELDGVFSEQCKQLTEKLKMNDKIVEGVRQLVVDVIEKLDTTVTDEQGYLELMKEYSKYNKLCGNVRGSLDTLKLNITSTNNSEKEILISDMQRSIEESIQTVEEQVNQVVALTKEYSKDKRYTTVAKTVEGRLQSLKKEYDQLMSMVSETLSRMEKAKKHRDVSTKLTETMRYVDKLKDRANALQLSCSNDDKSMINVEQEELHEIEQEVEKLASQNVSTINDDDDDEGLKIQRVSLEYSVSELQSLLATRRSEATTQGNISVFMRVVDKLEKQAQLLQIAIDDAAPHHAPIVNNKFSKTDLQSLLKDLIASYKKYEPDMTKLVKKAKSEAGKHTSDDRVSERLARALARCNKIKAAAAARERELQTCINQLDHDFFTKLAVAKTTSTKRRGASGSGVGPSGPSSSNAKRSGNTLPPPLPSTAAGVSMSRRSSSQGSTASNTRHNRTSLRPSKTPIPSRSVSRTKYVADPKNELDMELGRIVNENLYRVKVKMVPGEVGKYWFGEVNPRLVYCRILPSKLVMVRVGGGWQELSQ
ncbi:hypothetical protein BDC45DRAFT_476153 [Circinella umbellata]|nr:hypothetical protein BDC45DRAFT_476153 [Circinella umbellata]